MTPLAYRITKELTLPVRQRTFLDQGNLTRDMGDIHCFEISDVFGMVTSQAKILREGQQKSRTIAVDDSFFFLPAPKTWIEFRFADGRREGVLLIEQEADGVKYAECVWAVASAAEFASAKTAGILLLNNGVARSCNEDSFPLPRIIEGENEGQRLGWCFWLWSVLSIINTPRIIGRRQHMPHRGLERRLVAMKGVVGKFPLHAWTEIKLAITPPKDASGEGSQEAHLTGERALHFCRAHLRIRLGKLEVVRGHWRGDASLGIRQSRYKLTNGRAA